MKWKNLTVVFSLIAVILVALLIIQNDQRPRVIKTDRVPPLPDSTLATTTPSVLSFGPLTNIYTDDQFGFSLKYPDEVGVASVQKSCKKDFYVKDASRGYPPFISIYNPSCPSPFANPLAKSLNDYRKDYVLNNGVIVSIVNNTKEIITTTGNSGIRQEYQTFANIEEMERSDFGDLTSSVRYVFNSSPEQFYILEVNYPDNLKDVYRQLEEDIVNTIQY